MGLLAKDNPDDLTEDEIAYLRSSSAVPEEVRQYLSRQHENIGTKVSAYGKIARAAKAERDVILEVRALSIVKGEDPAGDARRDADGLRTRNAELAQEVERQRERAIHAVSEPARAIHSDPSQR